jgi:hypothetical protein
MICYDDGYEIHPDVLIGSTRSAALHHGIQKRTEPALLTLPFSFKNGLHLRTTAPGHNDREAADLGGLRLWRPPLEPKSPPRGGGIHAPTLFRSSCKQIGRAWVIFNFPLESRRLPAHTNFLCRQGIPNEYAQERQKRPSKQAKNLFNRAFSSSFRSAV